MKKIYYYLGMGIVLITLFSGCDRDGQNQESQNPSESQEILTTAQETDTSTEAIIETTSTEASDKVLFYMDKLKDQTYTSTYGDDEEPNTWYTAAEELGQIGKPAIPYLIANLDTTDPYEKGLTLYALLLASQHQNVQSITGGEYINVNLTFIPEEQVQYVKDAQAWWSKYKDSFE